MPGAWLLRIAGIVFDETVLSSVVHPTIADLRSEWLEAGASPGRRMLARGRGYFAFWSLVAMAPVALRHWPSRRPDRRAFWKIQWRFDMTPIAGIRLVTILFVLGLAAGYVIHRVRPEMYRATAVIQFTPTIIAGGVSDDARPASAGRLEDRLLTVTQVVLSRTRLERVIHDFNVYEAERQSMAMEEVVSLLRRHIEVRVNGPSASTGQFVVSYVGSDPASVGKVTERLAASIIDESMRQREAVAEATLAFLESRIDKTGNELAALTADLERTSTKGGLSIPRRLEIEVMETTYKTLLTRRVEAQVMRDLDRRQIGEQFKMLDAAQVPQRPIGPTRLQLMLAGGAAGIVAAAFIALAAWVRRMLRGRRDLAPATS